jgi:hypothetical protein
MQQTYRGSCHCGALRFEAEIDLAQPTYRCNCSICRRTRFWPAIVPPDNFRVLAGEDQLTEYRFNSRANVHYFCRHCGVRGYGVGSLPGGGRIVGVNLGCLEEVDDATLAAAPVVYIDGRDDRWDAAPAITSHM